MHCGGNAAPCMVWAPHTLAAWFVKGVDIARLRCCTLVLRKGRLSAGLLGGQLVNVGIHCSCPCQHSFLCAWSSRAVAWAAEIQRPGLDEALGWARRWNPMIGFGRQERLCGGRDRAVEVTRATEVTGQQERPGSGSDRAAEVTGQQERPGSG
eukprot:357074-Chlamydomonas_euryale.AAC.9